MRHSHCRLAWPETVCANIRPEVRWPMTPVLDVRVRSDDPLPNAPRATRRGPQCLFQVAAGQAVGLVGESGSRKKQRRWRDPEPARSGCTRSRSHPVQRPRPLCAPPRAEAWIAGPADRRRVSGPVYRAQSGDPRRPPDRRTAGSASRAYAACGLRARLRTPRRNGDQARARGGGRVSAPAQRRDEAASAHRGGNRLRASLADLR